MENLRIKITVSVSCLLLLFWQFSYDNNNNEKNPAKSIAKLQAQVGVDTLFGLYPKATVGKYFGGKITRDQLLEQKDVFVHVKDLTIKFEVVYFEITVAFRGDDLVKAYSIGSSITKQMRDIFERLKVGDRVFFDEIKVVGPNDKKYKVPGIAFEII